MQSPLQTGSAPLPPRRTPSLDEGMRLNVQQLKR